MNYIFTQYPCNDITTEEFLTLYECWDKSVKAVVDSKELDAKFCSIFVTNRCKSALIKIKKMVDDEIEFEKEKKRERKILNTKSPKQIRTENKKKKLLIDKQKKKKNAEKNANFVTIITEEFSFICIYIVPDFNTFANLRNLF